MNYRKVAISVVIIFFSFSLLCFTVSSVNATDPKLPPPPYLQPGSTSLIGIWNINVGIKNKADGGIILTRKIGGEYFSKASDSGYIFALVPVSVTNASKKTDTLFLVTWKLMDNRLYLYEEDIFAESYLPDGDDLNLMDVPPGATRKGYIVMQIKEGPYALYFTVEASKWQATWKLK